MQNLFRAAGLCALFAVCCITGCSSATSIERKHSLADATAEDENIVAVDHEVERIDSEIARLKNIMKNQEGMADRFILVEDYTRHQQSLRKLKAAQDRIKVLKHRRKKLTEDSF